MSFWYRAIFAAGVSATIAVTGTTLAADQEVKLADLPPAVKATLEQQAKGATIGEIELEDEDGRKVYTAELQQDGKEREIIISTDGKFLGEEVEDGDDDGETDDDDNETTVELSQVPDAVRARIQQIVGSAPIKELKSEREGAATIYEAEYDVNGQEHSVELAADGTVLEVEKHIAKEALPAAVSEAIKQKFPAGTIKEAEQVELHFINVEITDGNKEHELKVSPSGEILESETED